MNCLLSIPDDQRPARPLIDRPVERDLRRIATVRLLTPPPSDPADPAWTPAWDHFHRLYAPALRRLVYDCLHQYGYGQNAMEEAADIVAAFVCKRLQDGRLNGPTSGILRFRDWLATQVWRFTIDCLRAKGADRRQPAGGFAPAVALRQVVSEGPAPALLSTLGEQIALDVVQSVLETIAVRKPKQAFILQDLIWGGGRQSADVGEILGVGSARLRGLRHAARVSFRVELRRLVQAGLFAEGDIEDLIVALRRITGSDK